jgi:hypothetical protein
MATVAELEAKIAILEARVRELETEQRDEFGIGPLLRRLFPADTRQHMRAAQREQLLAIRSLLDRWIESTSQEPAMRRRETIRIE